GCSDLAIAPNGTTMYLATGDIEGNRNSLGILKSTDGGVTWNPTALVFDPAVYPEKLSKLLMDPNNPLKMVVASSYGAYYTTDGWATYSSSVFSGATPDLKDMEFKPGTLNANTVYASGTGFYKSTDFGANWTEITNGLPTSGVSRIAIAVTADDAAYVYALYGKSSDESYMGTYRSTDNGTTFTNMSTTPNLLAYTADGSDAGGQAFFDLAIVASPTDKENITIGGVNHWRSFDGGATWENTSVWNTGEIHADVHEIIYQPSSSTTMYSCNDGGLFVSYDNGNQWIDISNNLTIGQVVKLGLSAYTATGIVAGEQDNGTILNESTGWYNINGGDGGECFIDPEDDNYIYVQYVQGAYSRSADGGATMTPIVNGLPSGIDFYSPFKMHPTNTYTLYSGGTPTLYTSVNYGDNWSALGTATGSDGIKEFVVAPSDPTVIYTVQLDAISKSTNSGASFTNVTTGLATSAAFSSVTVSTTDANKVWVTYSGYDSANKVYKSVDGGVNWTNISAGLPNVPMNTIVYRNNGIADEVYLGADIGVFIANNNVSSWQPYMTSLPNVAVRDLEIFYPTEKLRAGTYGRGIWESNLNNQTLGIENNIASNNTVFISMDENDNLQIKSAEQDINKVVIFDILGKKVFEKEKIDATVFNNPSMVRSQRVLFVKTTLANGTMITNKILF
ncbi:MAG: T9SS sorting signal type C domain-containing protein, partial [Oceanihabitans sp.]|nr:T9SS sorting signal type C domain-containing protein [Oceanihabitans sp.]